MGKWAVTRMAYLFVDKKIRYIEAFFKNRQPKYFRVFQYTLSTSPDRKDTARSAESVIYFGSVC